MAIYGYRMVSATEACGKVLLNVGLLASYCCGNMQRRIPDMTFARKYIRKSGLTTQD